MIVFDFRNHGWNRCGDQKYHNPRVFAEDLETILSEASRVFGAGPCAGIFHSLSALVSLLLPSRGAELEALILFDPPLCKPGMSQLQFERHMEQALQMIRRRTTHFRTEAEFTALAEYSPLLRGLEHRVKQLLAQTTLRPSPDGSGYELRCPPDYEAQAGEFITAYAVLADLDTMRCPVKVIGADPTVPFTYLPSFDPEIVAKVDYDFIPEIGHFVPLAAPERSHELCLNFLREQGIVRAGA